MPYKLRITKEEVKAELKRMGYDSFPDEVVELFRKDLLKLIKNDLKKLKELKQLQNESPGFCSSSKLYETSMPSSYLDIEKEKTRICQDISSKGSPYFSSEKASKLSHTSSEYLPKSEETEKTEVPSASASVKIQDKQKLNESNKKKEVDLPSYPGRPDPVNLYHYYKAHWDKFKVPGEDPRRTLRWEVRSKLFYSS